MVGFAPVSMASKGIVRRNKEDLIGHFLTARREGETGVESCTDGGQGSLDALPDGYWWCVIV